MKETFELIPFYKWERVIKILEAQEPWWTPGTKSGYHLLTYGYLLGELVKWITEKTLGIFFKEEIAEPLEADFYIEMSEEYDERVAEIISQKLI